MDAHPRLLAYGWDIAGSLAGTIAFACAAAAGLPPWVWPPVLAIGWAIVFAEGPIRRAAVVCAGLAFLGFGLQSQATRWSPYYLLHAREDPVGLRVFVNSSFHQLALDFRSKDPALLRPLIVPKPCRAMRIFSCRMCGCQAAPSSALPPSRATATARTSSPR